MQVWVRDENDVKRLQRRETVGPKKKKKREKKKKRQIGSQHKGRRVCDVKRGKQERGLRAMVMIRKAE